jgi:hypothetical protein
MTDGYPLSIRSWNELRQSGRFLRQQASSEIGSTAHTRQLAVTIDAQEKFLFHLLTLIEERRRARQTGEI